MVKVSEKGSFTKVMMLYVKMTKINIFFFQILEIKALEQYEGHLFKENDWTVVETMILWSFYLPYFYDSLTSPILVLKLVAWQTLEEGNRFGTPSNVPD